MTVVDPYISRCGSYDCVLCDYHRGTIVEAARGLLAYAERYGSLRLIAEYAGAYDFDEFMRGLRWIASREEPCRGCRMGGGWSCGPTAPSGTASSRRGSTSATSVGASPAGG